MERLRQIKLRSTTPNSSSLTPISRADQRAALAFVSWMLATSCTLRHEWAPRHHPAPPVSVIFSLPQDQLPQVNAKLRSGVQLAVDAYDRDDTA